MWITWNTASFPCHLLLHFLVHLPDDDLWTTRGTVQRSHMWSWNQSRRWTGNEARFSQVWFLTTEFCQNAKQDGITIGLLPRPNNPRVDCFKYLYGEDRSCDLCGGICSSMKCQFHLHMTWFLLYKFYLHVYSGALHSLWILNHCHCMVTLWQYSAYLLSW